MSSSSVYLQGLLNSVNLELKLWGQGFWLLVTKKLSSLLVSYLIILLERRAIESTPDLKLSPAANIDWRMRIANLTHLLKDVYRDTLLLNNLQCLNLQSKWQRSELVCTSAWAWGNYQAWLNCIYFRMVHLVITPLLSNSDHSFIYQILNYCLILNFQSS